MKILSTTLKSKKIKTNNQSGAAMLTSVIFFLFITLAIISGLVGPTVSEFKSASFNLNSKKAYFLAESGGEDAFYRIKNNMTISDNENLILDSNSATTTILDDGFGSKSLVSLGDVSSLQRKTSITIQAGAGSSFNYGVQVGDGGLILENSSSVSGNVYSNGPVSGSAGVNTGNVTAPSLVGSVTVSRNVSPNTAIDIAINASGKYLYALNEGYFEIIDINNPANPQNIKLVNSQYYSNPYHNTIRVSGNYLYITSSNANYLDIYDITDPLNPVLKPHVQVGSGSRGFCVANGFAYVPNYNDSTLSVVNVANPNNASVVSTLTIGARPTSCLVKGNYLYVVLEGPGNYGSIQAFSITTPSAPVFVGSTPAGTLSTYTFPLYGAGQYLYSLSYSLGGMQVESVTNPASPQVVWSTAPNSIYEPAAITGAAGYLYVAVYSPHNSNRAMEIWSITNPSTPSKVNSISVSASFGNPKAIAVSNGYVFLLNSVNNGISKVAVYGIGGGSGGNLIAGDVVSAGGTGSMSKIHATGSAYSHTITDSIIDKNAYYQTMSTTTVAGTTYPGSVDQSTSTMPIPDSTISQWETDAANASVINSPCPYTISGSSSVTLGPVKINCDLQLSNSASLTLSGNIWVNGNVTLSNSGTIQVGSGISGKTVGIIADSPTNHTTNSKITVSNSTNFAGSGTNSYVMLVSQNNSAETGGSQIAIDAQNSMTGKVLLYAPHGQVHLSNSSSIKEVTGWKLILSNSAQVIYETGLAHLLFTSGPAGGYVFDKWGEAQ